MTVRTGAAAHHRGYFHEAVYYGSDDDLLAVAVPFLRGGVEAGEPTVVSLGERTAGLIRDAIGESVPITYAEGGSVYERPAGAIKAYRELLAGYVAEGAGQIRIIGEIPEPSLGATWDSWARYEAVINHAYDDFPLWSMCAYDTRMVPAHVLEDVARTHPRVAQPDGSHPPSPPYQAPGEFLLDWRPIPHDPVQDATPVLELTNPTAAHARSAVAVPAAAVLTAQQLSELTLAVSEVVTNALRYGVEPVRLRLWLGPDRVVVSVTDLGAGPGDPFAGLVPLSADGGAAGGLGLWIAGQLCGHLAFARDAEGFTVRLTTGVPYTGLGLR